MSISKMLADKQAGLKSDLASFVGKGEGASAGVPLHDATGGRTGPGKMLLAGEEMRVLQAQVEDLKGRLQSMTGSREIDLNDLVIIPGRQRHLSPQEFQELKANLSQNPLATPVTVRDLGNGRFELISGHNRVQVYRELGRTAILAAIVDADDDAVERMAFYANLLSPSLPPYDKFIGLKRRAAQLGLTQQQLADESGLSRQSVSLYFAFDDLDPRILRIVEDAADRSYFGPAAVQVFVKVPPEKLEQAVELARAVAGGQLTIAAAQSKLNPSPAVDKAKPLHLRRGSKVVCSIQRKGKTVSLAFKDESPLDDEFVRALKDFLAGRMGLKESGQ